MTLVLLLAAWLSIPAEPPPAEPRVRGAWVVEAVTFAQSTAGDTIVVVDLSVPPGRELDPGELTCLDFEVEPVQSQENTIIEAYIGPADPLTPVNLTTMEPLTTWEITPADHDMGQGGVVRLNIPSDAPVDLNTGVLRIMLRAQGLSSAAIMEVLGAHLMPNTLGQQ